jgi:peptidoglycan hydrolase CwlO-like protein
MRVIMKKIILILTLILLALFSITSVCAGDVNDAVISNQDDSQIELTAIEDNIKSNIDENQAIGEIM